MKAREFIFSLFYFSSLLGIIHLALLGTEKYTSVTSPVTSVSMKIEKKMQTFRLSKNYDADSNSFLT